MWAYTVGFTVLPHVGGFLGWFMNRKEIPVWYEKLKKPSWCPSQKIFPVAWTVLYTGMGYASYLIWNDLGGCSSKAVVPLGLYGAQLALNWAWPPFFFGARNLKMALIDILCLDALAIGTVCSWYRINKVAALLLVPYLGWLAMATCLTIRIWFFAVCAVALFLCNSTFVLLSQFTEQAVICLVLLVKRHWALRLLFVEYHTP